MKKHRKVPNLINPLLPPPELHHLLVVNFSLSIQNLTTSDWVIPCPISLNKWFNVITFIQHCKHQAREYTFSYLLRWNYIKFTSCFISVFRSTGKKERVLENLSYLKILSKASSSMLKRLTILLFPNQATF